MNSGLLLILAGLAVLWAAALQYQMYRLSKRTSILMTGSGGKNLEELLITHMKGLKDALDEVERVKKMNEYLDDIASRSIHKVGLIRFNPFQDTGSDQSFALALLDLNDHGVVLSSIHGREGTRIYAKPIKAGTSEHHLSKEEIEAIEQAKKTPLAVTKPQHPEDIPIPPSAEIEADRPAGVDISKPEESAAPASGAISSVGVNISAPQTPAQAATDIRPKPVIEKRPLGSLTAKPDIAASVKQAEEKEEHGEE